MARRATFIKSQREKHKNVLLLTGGNSFYREGSVPEVAAETTIDGMNLMRYDALAVGEGELSLGPDFFRKLQEKAFFPFISANVLHKDTSRPLAQQFLVKEVSGIKVGITAVVAPHFFQLGSQIHQQINVEDPVKALKRIIPEIRKRAEFVILLSHLGEADTRALVQSVPGIGIAVIGHDSGVMEQPVRAGNTILVKNCNKGMHMGVLEVALGPKAVITQTHHAIEKISDNIANDPEMEKLVVDYKKIRRNSLKEKLKADKKRQMEEELLKQLNLSPEEYMQEMQKKGSTMPAQPQAQ